MKRISKSIATTRQFAAMLAMRLREPSQRRRAIIVALEGELGAGKTVFAQGFAQALGIQRTLKSPTFLLMREYPLECGKLYHLDCYRVNSARELSSLGIRDIMADPQNIVLVEWPERIATIIPKSATRVHIDHLNERERSITISTP